MNSKEERAWPVTCQLCRAEYFEPAGLPEDPDSDHICLSCCKAIFRSMVNEPFMLAVCSACGTHFFNPIKLSEILMGGHVCAFCTIELCSAMSKPKRSNPSRSDRLRRKRKRKKRR